MGPGFFPPAEAYVLIAAVVGPLMLAFGWMTRRWVAQKDRLAEREAEQTRRNREQAEEVTKKLLEAQKELIEARGQIALLDHQLRLSERECLNLRQQLHGGRGMKFGDGA